MKGVPSILRRQSSKSTYKPNGDKPPSAIVRSNGGRDTKRPKNTMTTSGSSSKHTKKKAVSWNFIIGEIVHIPKDTKPADVEKEEEVFDEGAALDDVDEKDAIDEPGHRDGDDTGTYPESTRTSSSEAAEEVESGACHDVNASVVSGEDEERIQDLLEKRRSSLRGNATMVNLLASLSKFARRMSPANLAESLQSARSSIRSSLRSSVLSMDSVREIIEEEDDQVSKASVAAEGKAKPDVTDNDDVMVDVLSTLLEQANTEKDGGEKNEANNEDLLPKKEAAATYDNKNSTSAIEEDSASTEDKGKPDTNSNDDEIVDFLSTLLEEANIGKKDIIEDHKEENSEDSEESIRFSLDTREYDDDKNNRSYTDKIFNIMNASKDGVGKASDDVDRYNASISSILYD